MAIPFLIVCHDHGASKRNVGGGRVKGIFYLNPEAIEEGLRAVVAEKEWASGHSYSATPVGVVIDQP